MKKLFTLMLITSLAISINAQENEQAGPTLMSSSTSMKHITSISSRPNDQIPIDMTPREAQDKRSLGNKVIIGKDPQTKNDFLASNPNYLTQKIKGKVPSNVFEAYTSDAIPTDPSLAVGPNHVFVVFNTGFRIFDKSGNPLTGQIAPNPAIFPDNGCCDLTASYDAAADRWVITFLNGAGAGAQVAVSDGPDPVNDGWYVYYVAAIDDYQKLSIWSDGYYFTDNNGGTNKIFALERDEMLLGNASAQVIGFPLPGIVTSGFFSPQAFNVSNDNMPAAGGAPFVYLQDDAWAGVTQDHIKLWTVDVDWATPGNSTISAAQTINTTPFISVFDGGSFSNLEEPGGASIDALQATIMNQAQFRKFGSHNSAIFNFVVDTDASGGELAGVRWFEFRQDDDNMPWSLYQEGTYTAPDGKHAWHASMIMDVQGNIGMGYTSMSGPTTSTTIRVSSYYTGRFANDPLGTMTINEELIANGTADIGGFRYGDYSKIDVDPTNDKTFWFINEYRNIDRKGVVGVFQIAPNYPNDTGVVSIDSPSSGSLGANEDVVVTVFNYGTDSQSNIPVNLTVEGSVVATGTLAGPLASASTAQFTFTGIDFSTEGHVYSVESCTSLGGDEESSNDCASTSITHLPPTDIGVSAITNPVSGTGLSASESITVTITNFGGATQSNFDVSYTLDGGTPVTEPVVGPLVGNSNLTYTFTQPGDFASLGNHDLSVTTSLSGDSDTTNDETSVVIVKSMCQPIMGCGTGDGFTLFQIGSINNASGCEGYADFTNLSADLGQDTTNNLTVTTGYGNQFVRVWIDFNDDYTFTSDELVVDNFEIADGQGSGSYTEIMDLVVPAGATLGSHVMRAKTNWNAPVPDDACTETTYGETEDYTANITSTATVSDTLFNDSDFVVSTLENNQFTITVNTSEITDRLNFSVTNMIGQKLLSYNLDNKNGGYSYDLDMSYAAPGVYMLRLGNSKLGNTKKIIVK